MGDLAKKLKFTRGRGQEVGELWCVRLNSGLFGVRWERTKRVLEQCGMDLHVVGPEEEEFVGEKRGKGKGKGGRDGKVEGGLAMVDGRAAEARPEVEGPATAKEPAADEADPSRKRKKSKHESQAPEMDNEPSIAETAAELESLPPRPEKPKKHKKHKRDTEPSAETLADSSPPTEKKRRKREAGTELSTSMQDQEVTKKRKKGKTERGAE